MSSEQLSQINFPHNQKWSTYQIDEAAYEIFVLLQQQPTMAVSQLAEELGHSTTLVNARLEELKKRGFLRPDRTIQVPFLGQRLQTEAEAIYEPSNLGLSRFNIFFSGIPSVAELHQLETILALHPYTHYHVASFGNTASLYCQVDIPPEATGYLQEFFDRLQQEGFFTSISELEQQVVARSQFDFSRWRLGTDQWELFKQHEFSETSFETEIDLLWSDFLATDTHLKIEPSSPQMRFRFDNIDLQLLRELTVNARINITELARHYEISRSRISRRIKRLRELAIKDERLVYDQSIFDLTYAQIIEGRFKDGDPLDMQSFYSFLTGGYLPFSTTAIMDEERFIWFTPAPPSYIPQLTRFMWQHAENITVHQLDISTSRTYYFYHKNLESKGKWRTDREYIVDSPLDTYTKLQEGQSPK